MACEMQLQWKHSNQLKNSGDSCPTATQDRPVAFRYIVKLQLLTKDYINTITTLGCIFRFFLKILKVNLTPASACMVCK